MQIDLPEINKLPGWTAQSQVDKITEELTEVKEAVESENPVEIIREALDVMQTCKTLIEIVLDDWEVEGKRMNFDKFIEEHRQKLERKGYLKEDFGPEDDKPIPYVLVEKVEAI